MQTNKDLLDKNHPNTLSIFSAEDFIKSKLKHPISPNIIHEIDSVLTQQYLEDVDYSKYIVFK